MIAKFIRTILSPFHGVISTGLDVFTGINPRPRDLINQDNAATQAAREEQSRKTCRTDVQHPASDKEPEITPT